MTHTPGPWHVDSTHVRHAINTENVHVAMANIGPGLTQEEAIANARLIAAAPRMYEYIENRAKLGSLTARKLLEEINAN